VDGSVEDAVDARVFVKRFQVECSKMDAGLKRIAWTRLSIVEGAAGPYHG